MSYRALNCNLIPAFVEHWQPETNSFYLSFSEITITSDDVFYLTGVNITGRPLQLVEDDVAPGSVQIYCLLEVYVEEAIVAVSDRDVSLS